MFHLHVALRLRAQRMPAKSLSTTGIKKIEFVEQFKVLLISKANRVFGIFEVSSASSTATIACIGITELLLKEPNLVDFRWNLIKGVTSMRKEFEQQFNN